MSDPRTARELLRVQGEARAQAEVRVAAARRRVQQCEGVRAQLLAREAESHSAQRALTQAPGADAATFARLRTIAAAHDDALSEERERAERALDDARGHAKACEDELRVARGKERALARVAERRVRAFTSAAERRTEEG